MRDFITIGGTTRDISFFTDEGLLLDNKGDVLRQKLLAFESGAKIKVDRFYYSFGGGAANAAVCLSRLGLKTACLATVGADKAAQLIKDNLRRQGVDTSLLQTVKGEESASSFVLVAPSGERIIFAQRGANTKLEINQRDIAAISRSANIYIASLSGQWHKNLKKIFSAAASGHQIFWNPGLTQYAAGVQPIASFLKQTSVLSSNRDEILQLLAASPAYRSLKRSFLDQDENLVKLVYELGPQLVVMTLGAEGVIAYDGKKVYRRPIRPERKRIDTTGIGDVFNSSFAAAWVLFAGDINRALDLSLRNAAAKISHLGAQNGLLRLAPRKIIKK